MQVTGVTHGTSKSSERTGKRASWGDYGSARTTTPEYEEGMDRIFGSKTEKVDTRTPEEIARAKRNAVKCQAYPY